MKYFFCKKRKSKCKHQWGRIYLVTICGYQINTSPLVLTLFDKFGFCT